LHGFENILFILDYPARHSDRIIPSQLPSHSLLPSPVAGRSAVLFSASVTNESETADPSATPDFLSRVAASVDCMWFSLRRTT
jgi:hypothetical protein